MKLQQIIPQIFSFVFFSIFIINVANAQCGTFRDSPKETEAKEAHVLYRDAIKMKNYAEAFPNWEKAFSIAPAADGKRSLQYSDGRTLYMDMYGKEKDEAKKEEYKNKVIELYEAQRKCYGEIEKNTADLFAREAYDRFYTFNTPYDETLNALKKAVEIGGNDVSYIALTPYAHIMVYNFTEKVVKKEEAREAHRILNEIADYNIANNEKNKEVFQQAKDAMNGTFAQIERQIFDCQYFKDKLVPKYKADPDNRELYLEVYTTLVSQGCEKTDPILVEINGKDEVFREKEYQAKKADWEANNPGVLARKLKDAGDYNGAIAKYDEALATETDPATKAIYLLRKAEIQYRNKGDFSGARANARKAAGLKSGWGEPYLLIGDMYVKGSKNCGDDWNTRLAIIAAIEKYAYAKSVDSSMADAANKRISRYRSALPEQAEGFMRGVKAGQKAKVGCWIAETVTVKFQ